VAVLGQPPDGVAPGVAHVDVALGVRRSPTHRIELRPAGARRVPAAQVLAAGRELEHVVVVGGADVDQPTGTVDVEAARIHHGALGGEGLDQVAGGRVVLVDTP